MATDPTNPQTNKKDTMSLVAHLVELRDMVLHCVIAILVVFLALFPFANELYIFIANPIISVLPKQSNIIAIGVISPFLTPLKMSLIFAVYISMPFLLYKIWRYIAPALYQHERSLVMPLVISSTALFYCGLAFSFYAVFPVVFGFLTSIGPSVVTVSPDIQYYLDFVLKLSFAFGVAFEVPVATVLLLMTGATTVKKLRQNRPYFIIGAFVIGMILTPPDIISQTLIAIPMWLLFEFGLIYFNLVHEPRRKKIRQAKQDLEDEEFDEIEKEFDDLKD